MKPSSQLWGKVSLNEKEDQISLKIVGKFSNSDIDCNDRKPMSFDNYNSFLEWLSRGNLMENCN